MKLDFKMKDISTVKPLLRSRVSKTVEKQAFKRCPICNQKWLTRDDFLSDPKIKLLGYQANFDELTLGAFLFNHEVCLDTLGVMVADLRRRPAERTRLPGKEKWEQGMSWILPS
jgi:hypothetical protein